MKVMLSMRCVVQVSLLMGIGSGLFAQDSSRIDWASYMTGGLTGTAQATVTDTTDGGVWVAGSSSAQFDSPGPNVPYQQTPKAGTNIFLAKYQKSEGGQLFLRFWTWIGGSGNEEVRAMTIDSQGRLYITGVTDSTDFPTTGYFAQGNNAGGSDAFLSIVDPRFSGPDSLVHSSYYGGTGTDVANAIAVDSEYRVYVAGYTTSDNLPGTSGGAQSNNRGNWESFFYKLDPSDTSPLRYASYFGGGSTDVATGITVDARGIVWFTGYTASDDFPVSAGSYRDTHFSQFDGFLVGINTNVSGLNGILYATYFGGNGADYPKGVLTGPNGTLWVTGYTYSSDLPVTETAVQKGYSGNADVFVMGFDLSRPQNQVVTYATYLGDGDTDIPMGFSLLDNGRIAISGYTASNRFPTTAGAIQTTRGGRTANSSIDAFVSILNTAGGIEYSTYLGGGLVDVATGVAVDSANGIVVSGYTNSNDFPTEAGGQPVTPVQNTPFLVRIVR